MPMSIMWAATFEVTFESAARKQEFFCLSLEQNKNKLKVNLDFLNNIKTSPTHLQSLIQTFTLYYDLFLFFTL